MSIDRVDDLPSIAHPAALQKGWPLAAETLALDALGRQGWSVLDGDLPLPCAVLKRSALEVNARLMRAFLAATGAVLCPHGKTTMSPELIRRQLNDGAWGITAATLHQARVMQRMGVRRIIVANQLVGRAEGRDLSRLLSEDPTLEIYVLVDSSAAVEQLTMHLRLPADVRLRVLLEVGQIGVRTGARTLDAALAAARAVRAQPALALCGLETYEGVIAAADAATQEARIAALYAELGRVARACESEDLFDVDTVIVTGGGSCFYDLAVRGLQSLGLSLRTRLVIRSGCYLTHDAGYIAEHHVRLRARDPARVPREAPQAALELFAHVQSRPEPQRAYATLGKRDVSHDLALPQPIGWYRPGTHDGIQPLSDHRVVGLNDQHAHLELPPSSPLVVGDVLVFGISHPCTTFDKWRLLALVDDDYRVVEAVRTYF